MKYITYIIIFLLLTALLLISLVSRQTADSAQPQTKTASAEHVYASWDTMELDKCVAAWLIVRFIDKDAKFVFYPQGTEINEGIVFDVPGADWSRKHRKCTSQCIIDSIGAQDPAVEKIVAIAGQVELNFWQLDRWPKVQKCFYEVKEITDRASGPLECFEKTGIYFDKLYADLKDKTIGNNNF